ncbi:putative mediator of RNA polymerase II transcription subunit 12 [Malaya genurostris]|uniref:putative mediator of RNA polymerase II transcription subunit 12 n=1 Tax=Malaya genurostris TaxID=325434 RepID=UPI0026F3FB54|nr:putative mediator of RNA polymerase II transcription subunit 12 [Malaya genurostris]
MKFGKLVKEKNIEEIIQFGDFTRDFKKYKMLKLPICVLFLVVTAAYGDYAAQLKPLMASAYGKPPLVHTHWPPKHGFGSTALKQYMVQLHSGSRLAPVAVRPAPAIMMSLKRPVKSVYSPAYPLLKQQYLKRPILGSSHTPFVLNLNLKHKFPSSPAGLKTGGIVFEKLKPIVPQSNGQLTSAKDGAIHTIPAPNLAGTAGKAAHQLQISSFDNNNHLEIDIHKTTKPAKSTFAPKPTYVAPSTPQPIAPYIHKAPYPPARAHQYQVTEEHTNDVTLKNPYSGQKTYFAPDPDPSLPSKSVSPTQDPLSEPSNGKYPPNDLLIQAQTQAQTHYLPQHSTMPLNQKPIYGIVNTAPQPGYGIPLAVQPQLQQHILQQTSMLQGMPLYNPTYLVTQSNNLFNNHQHQQQTTLFKPETSFLGTVPSPQPADGNVVFNSYTYKHEPAASAGQILAATQDQLHELQSAVSQIQLNDLQQQHSHDAPTYAQLVGHEQLALHQQQIPQQNQLEQQLQQQLIQQQEKSSHQLTENEIANLLNYGTINLHNQLSPNDYYHYQVDQEQQQQQQQQQDIYQYPHHHHRLQHQQQEEPQSLYELSQRQQENERILAQAQQDLLQQQQQQQLSYQANTLAPQQQQLPPTQATQSTDYLLAYQQHQQAVANALELGTDSQNSKRATLEPETTHVPLRIFVPDSESDYPNSVNPQTRMDELNYEYADGEERTKVYPTESSAKQQESNKQVDSEQERDSSKDKIESTGSSLEEEHGDSQAHQHYSNHRLY